MAKLCHLVVIRHGERLDEADEAAWRSMRTADNKHDPPLTENGWRQATLAGKRLQSLLSKAFPSAPEVSVLSSPAARTLATAAAVAEQLGVQTVTPVYSLNCCAAAQMHGVNAQGMCSEPSEEQRSRWRPTVAWPPQGDPQRADRRVRAGFVGTVKELAAEQAPDSVLVLVTHREGIWELCRRVGLKLKMEYCCAAHVTYDFATQTLGDGVIDGSVALAAMRQPPSGAAVTPPRARRNLSSLFSTLDCRLGKASPLPPPPLPGSPATAVADLLASGAGRVRLGRRGSIGSATTSLWKTPGVRGVWVPGPPLADGTELELLSSPQASEAEGDFVLVRAPDGREGWTKVVNIVAAP